jgi:hypothetical protein
MNYNDLYADKTSNADKPSILTVEVMKLTPPDVDGVLRELDFTSCRELAEAYTDAWFTVATDRYLCNKLTQQSNPAAKILLQRAQRICTAADITKTMTAKAEGLWLQHYERKEITRRRNVVFSGEKSENEYLAAQKEIARIYRLSADDLNALHYFVCQTRSDESDPALNRALYIWSNEKMTGKTTVAKIIAGILNGCTSWMEARRGDFMSDIPTELQFNNFARPKATRFACVVMDEAFSGGKSTAKYYGKFKTALTSDTVDVEVKFGGKYTIPCTRNYIFTSNNDISSVVNDESERRLFEIRLQKPEYVSYERLFDLWRAYIVNAPDVEDVAGWYRDTMPKVKGEIGINIDDLVSAFLSPDFYNEIERYEQDCDNRLAAAIAQGKTIAPINRYQVSFPKFFSAFITTTYDVRKNTNIVKDAVARAFGEPKQSGTRKYYNISELKQTIQNAVQDAEQQQQRTAPADENELPY